MAKEKEEKVKNSSIHWYPGHMAKATREIEDRVKLVDLIIELRDARAPLSTANPLIGAIKNKPHLIILTKIDMADPKETDRWVKALKNDNQECMALNLTQFNAYQQIVAVSKKLLAEKMAREQARGLKPRPVRAMVVGIPNVGKSTLINRLAKRKATITGDKPGVTKSQQIIKVDRDFELFDTPGILWPRLDDRDVAMHIALCGSIKSTILPHDEIFIYAMQFLNQYYPHYLKERYKLEINMEDEQWIEKAFNHISNARGIQKVRGDIDYDRVMELVFNDILKGTIGKLTWQRHDQQN